MSKRGFNILGGIVFAICLLDTTGPYWLRWLQLVGLVSCAYELGKLAARERKK